MNPSLFGRSAELALIDDALAGVTAGRRSLVFIEGEAGIGKSALLGEVIARARDLGVRVFTSRAEELEQDRPFRAIEEALGCTGAHTDARRAEIVRMLGAGSEGEGVFYRLIDAFEDLVEAETLNGATLITIDDLQWVDAGTVRALGRITRRMGDLPLAVVGALRREPRREDLAAFMRATSSPAIRLSLRPLEEGAITKVVEGYLGSRPGPRLRAHVDGAGGNPFYILELLDTLAAESAITFDGTSAEIAGPTLPPSLVLTILRRLSVLPDRALEIVRSAAVLGTSFRIEHLATAAGVSEDETLEAVKILRSHGVLADAGEKLRFRHDLIREAVYEDLGEPVRVSMHHRIGNALATAGASPMEVAVHLMRGALPGDAAAACLMIEAAADPAAGARTSVALIERALEINPTHPRYSMLVVRQARLLHHLGRPEEALSRLQRLLPQIGEISERLSVVVALVDACFATGRVEDMRGWIEQGAALGRQLLDSTSPQVLNTVGRALNNAEDLDGVLAAGERAITLARESADAVEEERAASRSSRLLTELCRSADALTRSEQALALPAESPATGWERWFCHACALGDLDRIDEAENALAVSRAISEEAGLPLEVWVRLMSSARLRYSLGRWDDALADAETAAAISEELDFVEIGPDPGTMLSLVAYHRNDLDGVVGSSRPSTQTRDRLWPTLQAVMAFDRGEVSVAGHHASETLDTIAANHPEHRDFDVLPTLARIALAAGDTTSARVGRDTAILRARAGAPGPALAAVRCLAIVDRDVSAAERAIVLARTSPRRLHAAQAFEDASSILDRVAATEVLADALSLYEQMGAVRDHARVAARLHHLGARAAIAPMVARPVSGWEALTPAELDVVRLAADGLTNREIGSALFISHRTVSTHLSHVFDKLGLRSRVELAREAAQRARPPTSRG